MWLGVFDLAGGVDECGDDVRKSQKPEHAGNACERRACEARNGMLTASNAKLHVHEGQREGLPAGSL
eukprot:1952940-Rhodomonas_salina.4